MVLWQNILNIATVLFFFRLFRGSRTRNKVGELLKQFKLELNNLLPSCLYLMCLK